MPLLSQLNKKVFFSLILIVLGIWLTPQKSAFAQTNIFSFSLNERHSLGPSSISPTIGELDDNPENGKEIVVGTSDGTISTVSSTGEILWSNVVLSVSCAGIRRSDILRSSPTIGVLEQDQSPSVVIGYGSMVNLGCDGGIIAYDGKTGNERWRFSVKDHSKKERYWAFRYGTYGRPTISNFMSDGKAFIAFGSLSRYIYLLDGSGKLRYFYQAADTVFSSPTFFTDHLNRNLFAIGQDISGNSRIRPITKNGGYLDLFSINKPNQRSSQINFRKKDNNGAAGLLSYLPFNQVVQSIPTVSELVASSNGAEILVTGGCFFPQGKDLKTGRFLTMTNSGANKIIAKHPLTACTSSAPIVYEDEKIIGIIDNGENRNGGPGIGKFIALKVVEDLSQKAHFEEHWSYEIPETSQWQSPKLIKTSAGEAAFVFYAGGKLRYLKSLDGALLGSVQISGSIMDSSVAVGDIDNDGDDEVAVVSLTRDGAVLRVFGF